MSRDTPLRVMAAVQLLICLGLLAWASWAIPSLLSAYEAAGLELPGLVRIVVAIWPWRLLAAAGGIIAAWALLSRAKRGARLRAVAVMVTLSSLGFVAAVIVATRPLLVP